MENRREHIISLAGLEIGYPGGKGRKQSLAGPVHTTAYGGEMIAVMGRNGSGKSTLLRTLAGLMKAWQGEIKINRRPLSAYSRKELARIIGYVSTEVVRVPGLTVGNLVALGRYPHTNWLGKLGPVDRTAIENALALTSLGAMRDRDLDELSDGERQRAMIARTLAQDTQILLLDEPTAFLDLSHRFEIIDLLGRLAGELGKTIVYSTHDLQIALQQADRIWLLDRRKLLEGAPEDLVLSGALGDALRQTESGTLIEMDNQTGEFSVKRRQHEEISLFSELEDLAVWTRKALERMGFKVRENKGSGLHVLVNKAHGSPVWRLEKSGKGIKFDSIYDLSLYLRTYSLKNQTNQS